ncbi:acetyl-CoA synthetase-like protein [Ascobolus immersus RN42]|uniref:Very long-chain fatty acid transport protein n=1 Tax=Ascobolus immersus RN42 TaxID=1160509 RepID=A0A3N4I7F7_ASCIM|nr:acetyl-CoA synthetase-like protein [Ascobolus immersus RN42]
MLPIPLAAIGPAAAALSYIDARLDLSNDYRILNALIRSKAKALILERKNRVTPFYLLEEAATTSPSKDRIFLIYQGNSWTYAEAYQVILKYGTWFKERFGIKKGDIVAMDFMNSNVFVFVWFGLWSIGATPAFINYNLNGDALVHSVVTSTAKLVLIDSEVAAKVVGTDEDGARTLQRLKTEKVEGTGEREIVVFDEGMERVVGSWSGKRAPDEDRDGFMLHDKAILIYTSGTTGLPKAAIVSYRKCLEGGGFVGHWFGLRKDDVFYTCMPLYHSSAAILGLINIVYHRATISIGRKFSNSTFWPEVRASNATIIQYVGEVCRYLLSAPPSPCDTDNKVRMAFGNGLRPDVWQRFKDRFGVETIAEFYASTEGTSGSWNYQSGTYAKGAIGRNGSFLKFLLGRSVAVVEIDLDTEMPKRDPVTGFAKRVAWGEPGELLWKLDPTQVHRTFQGYWNNPGATESKILRDVFVKGDAWFRSGDLQSWTDEGLWYFIDRIGDTFRWKSENVSTAEVSQSVGVVEGVKEANVYGVEIPGHDGRAGCAALVLDPVCYPVGESQSVKDAQNALMAKISEHLLNPKKSGLPRFAVPLFLRVLVGEDKNETTGNFKMVKKRLRDQGVDWEKVTRGGKGDELWWLKPGATQYTRFSKADWEEIKGGRVKL